MKAAIKRINREIGSLAIPNIVSNVSVPLLSSVDTILMGQISAASLAAVGVGSMVFNVLYWNMGFLRMGTTGMTAQAYGRNDTIEMPGVLLKAALLGLLISALFLVFQKPLFDVATWAMSMSSDQFTPVWQYYSIRIWAAPASLLLMALMGWFFGMQNARIPLWITILINCMNILASYIFVKNMDMGIAGAAWGTLLAQYFGVLIAIGFIVFRYKDYFSKSSFLRSSILDRITALLRVNQNIFIRTLFLSTAFLLIFRFSREISLDILAINVVFLQFLNWMSYAIDGFAYAAESLVGKYKGANDKDGLILSINWNMNWGFVFALVFALVYYLFTPQIFQLFMESDDGKILTMASKYFIWMALLPIVGFASYIWDGIFVGLTATVAMRNSMIAAFLVYIISYLLLPTEMGNHRIWLAFFLFLISRGAFQWIIFKRLGWERIR